MKSHAEWLIEGNNFDQSKIERYQKYMEFRKKNPF